MVFKRAQCQLRARNRFALSAGLAASDLLLGALQILASTANVDTDITVDYFVPASSLGMVAHIENIKSAREGTQAPFSARTAGGASAKRAKSGDGVKYLLAQINKSESACNMPATTTDQPAWEDWFAKLQEMPQHYAMSGDFTRSRIYRRLVISCSVSLSGGTCRQ